MTFMATYSYLSTLSLRRCSVKFNILSMQAPSPSSRACARVMDLPRLTRISPGVDIERKQHENSSSSHQALISNDIWSSIYKRLIRWELLPAIAPKSGASSLTWGSPEGANILSLPEGATRLAGSVGEPVPRGGITGEGKPACMCRDWMGECVGENCVGETDTDE
ncbi:unnamed protein product [Timema podura]|uniref:Uncharacterized protein n=1 Tax=Timema podura TaxID=61482 RepID=A0ABN7NK48_TIMPD|nr:unnamed protein product [Timema podura]